MKKRAIVIGSRGRLGRAFAMRLPLDGFEVEEIDLGDPPPRPARIGEMRYLFDLAYTHEDPNGHLARVTGHLADWQQYEAIFVPSSLWIGTDSPYGRAKQAVVQLASVYTALGAHIVTDPIGYFPGDGVDPDPTEPLYAHRVTGDALYARVMARMEVGGPSARSPRPRERLQSVQHL